MRSTLTHKRRRGLGIGIFEELWSPPLSDKQKRVVRGKTSTLLFYMRFMTNYFCFCDNLICPWTALFRGNIICHEVRVNLSKKREKEEG